MAMNRLLFLVAWTLPVFACTGGSGSSGTTVDAASEDPADAREGLDGAAPCASPSWDVSQEGKWEPDGVAVLGGQLRVLARDNQRILVTHMASHSGDFDLEIQLASLDIAEGQLHVAVYPSSTPIYGMYGTIEASNGSLSFVAVTPNEPRTTLEGISPQFPIFIQMKRDSVETSVSIRDSGSESVKLVDDIGTGSVELMIIVDDGNGNDSESVLAYFDSVVETQSGTFDDDFECDSLD